MLDIIFIRATDKPDWLHHKRFAKLKQRFPFVRMIEGANHADVHLKAAVEANTNFFFLVDSTFIVSDDFHFQYTPQEGDENAVTRFLNEGGDHRFGVRLFHKSAFKQGLLKGADFVDNFGELNVRDVNTIASRMEYVVPSIFLASRDMDDWSINYQLKNLKAKFPHAEVVENADVVDLHFEIARKANSNYFFVLDAGYSATDDFDLSYTPDLPDEKWVSRFKNSSGCHVTGLRMFLKNAFEQTITDKKATDFVNDFGVVGVKDIDLVYAKKDTIIPDIVFFARDLRNWSNKDKYERLKQLYPTLKYVENDDVVDGHFEAARLAETEFFYVIDANFEPDEDIILNYKPSRADSGWVTRFKNVYGSYLCGLRLFHKSGFTQKIKNKKKHDFINDFGDIGVKDMDIKAAINVANFMPDVILLAPDWFDNWRDSSTYDDLYGFGKVARGSTTAELHKNAALLSKTSFFYVVDYNQIVEPDFSFDILPDPEDANWVRRFKSDNGYEQGIRLMHKQIALQENIGNADFINTFGEYGVKDEEIQASSRAKLDIIFIDSGESFANAHFKELKSRVGKRLHRVSNVKGLWNAHAEAAKISTTASFYVVDADASIHPNFEFNFIPDVWNEKYVYIWNALNELTGLSYGNGGVKLLHKSFFIEKPTNYIDMTTTIGHNIAEGIKIMEETSCFNRFYEDPFLAWRGAFRECAKLKSGIISGSLDVENEERLNAWLNIDSRHPNANIAKLGVMEGVTFVEVGNDLALVNDYEFLKEKYEARTV